MSRSRSGGTGLFRREWNFAFGLLAAAAGLLFAAGYNIAGGIAFALCAAGYAARRRAMRKQGLLRAGKAPRLRRPALIAARSWTATVRPGYSRTRIPG